MKIPAKKVIWFGVYCKNKLFGGRVLESVNSTLLEANAVRDKLVADGAGYYVESDFMVEEVEVKMKACNCSDGSLW